MLEGKSSALKFSSIITILVWFIVSWLLLHLLSVLGIFLAVAYPMWWFLVPSQTVCFLCRTKREGEYCSFCKKTLNKEAGIIPRTFMSAVYNGLIILVFSFISILIVFGESKLLLKLGFPPAPKTVSFVIPSKGQFRLGEIFPIEINIVGINTPINAIQADLGFDSSRLEVIDISTKESFASIFIQKELNNEGGYARLTGGLPNPGFSAQQGIFGTAYFKGKTPGLATIEFLPSSVVLANDGHGTNVLKDLASVSYLILPERVSEEEEDLQRQQVSFMSTTLGVNTENTQMKFYEENNVLGATVKQEIDKGQEEKEPGLFKILLEKLAKIDRFVLKQWGKVLSSFKFKQEQ